MQKFLPDPPALPVPQPAPTGDTRTATHFQGKHLPRDAAAQDKDDAGEASAVIDRRSAPVTGTGLVLRKQGGNRFPEFVGD